jgi:DNA-binding PadR family transcriptional regulator
MAKGEYLGEFEQVVLLAVARLEGEGYGVTIRREIEVRTGRDASMGAVYATLDRMQDKGLLESREGEPTGRRGGRARRHFSVTADGWRSLAVTREMLASLWEGLDARAEAIR